MLYPLTFRPIFKERVWGGRNLERLYRKVLPPETRIGESWEIADRPGDVSVIANGPLAGKSLRWLMEHHERDLLGDARSQNGLFPLLIKILDAEETLSLQVHPPAAKAAALGGEPKTEMWYIADARPPAELFVGLKRDVTRREFEQRVQDGTVAGCFHQIRVSAGDAMFLPSGRVHAIGAGLVLFEVQQNSDTTYRVFDWNRTGLDGKPRELHVAQSLASIDFNDIEPGLVNSSVTTVGPLTVRTLVDDVFRVELNHAGEAVSLRSGQSQCRVIGVVSGEVMIADAEGNPVTLCSGSFGLIPASIRTELWVQPGSTYLTACPGR